MLDRWDNARIGASIDGSLSALSIVKESLRLGRLCIVRKRRT